MPSASARANTVVSRGVLGGTGVVIDYYTSQPAPTQWVAIGLARLRASQTDGAALRQLVVGAGRSEAAAIQALRGRLPSAATYDIAGFRAPIDVLIGTALSQEIDAHG